MTSPTDDLLLKIEKLKHDFLSNEGKHTFFKKSQKMECAQKISQAFDLNEMIRKTIYIVPGSNKFIFDYRVFKLYAHPQNYDAIVNYVISQYDIILLKFDSFETNVILDSFTISAAERYKEAIKLFCNKCMSAETKYSKLINRMNIFYTPSMFESISTLLKPFIDKNVIERIFLFSKTDSHEMLKKLYL
jgi:hypothetical protein